MNREEFNLQFAVLAASYPSAQKIPEQTQDIYWEMLRDLSEGEFKAAVQECLASCKFFPTIAELGDAALPVNGLGYNWRQQIARSKTRQEALEYRKVDPAIRGIVKGITDGKKI